MSNQPLILVTGGTGFVGTAVTQLLLQRGYRVRVLHRGKRKPAAGGNLSNMEFVRGDAADHDTALKACAGADAILHLPGIIRECGSNTFQRVHVEAARVMAEAAKKAGVKRFVHLGSLGARPGARSRYHQTKWEGEQIIRSSGLDWTVFHASFIYGEGDGLVSRLRSMVLFPMNLLQLYVLPNFGGGHSKFQPIAVDQVALALVNSLGLEKSFGKTYDLCGPEPLTMTEITAAVIQGTGQSFHVEEFPTLTLLRHLVWALALYLPPLMALAWWMGCTSASGYLIPLLLWILCVKAVISWRRILLFHFPWVLAVPLGEVLDRAGLGFLFTGQQMLMLMEDNTGDPAPAARDLGLKLVPFAEGISHIRP